ncbi:hypothetical protein BEN47_01400 [Hymenobacter lapidarius]|uniref:O-antigen ligase-related domain-containing protein n=2 Tax=Hymenobacter lapidarius TaxID=1908237 RepID=A0A1G1T5T2_9BACT|nr:hypothetical protein BEN47_01400 [Hymenobacter lapidarius]
MQRYYSAFMQSVFTLVRLHQAALFFSACVIVGIFVASWVRVLPSIGMAGIAATGIVYTITYRRVAHWSYWPLFGSALWCSCCTYFKRSIPLRNMDSYWEDLVLQLPFLALIVGFWMLPALPGRYLRWLWLLLIGVTAIAAAGATINYILHFRAINEMYLHSKVMPTEPDHIRFSLIITMSVAAGVLLLVHGAVKKSWRFWVIATISFLVIFLHLLAVRSGQMTFYALSGLAVVWLALKKRMWKRAIALGALLVLLPAISYVVFPTFNNKVENTQQDVSKVQQESALEGRTYSIAARVYSYRAALAVWNDNKAVGVGKPDLQDEMAKHYAILYPEIGSKYYILPHNQYLYNLAAYGGLGLFVFLIGMFYPAWWARKKHAPLLLAQYVSVALSFLVEYTLETQIGLAFVVFFTMLALQGSLPCEDDDSCWRPA